MILYLYFLNERLVYDSQDQMIATFSVDVIENVISVIEARNEENAKKAEKANNKMAQKERTRILQLLEEIRGFKPDKYIHEIKRKKW